MADNASTAAATGSQAAAHAPTPTYANTITSILPHNIDQAPTFTESDIVSALSSAGIQSATGLIVNKGGHNIELTLTNDTERITLLTTGLSTPQGLQRFREFTPTTFAVSIGNVPVEAPDNIIRSFLAQHGLKVQTITTVKLNFPQYPEKQFLSGRRTAVCDRPTKTINLPHTHRLPSGRIISIRHSGQGPKNNETFREPPPTTRPNANSRDLPPAHRQTAEQISDYRGPRAPTTKSFHEKRMEVATKQNNISFMKTYELPNPVPTNWDQMILANGEAHLETWESFIRNKRLIPERHTPRYFQTLIKLVKDIEPDYHEYWQHCLDIAQKHEEHNHKIKRISNLVPVFQSNQFAALAEESTSQGFDFTQTVTSNPETFWANTPPPPASFIAPMMRDPAEPEAPKQPADPHKPTNTDKSTNETDGNTGTEEENTNTITNTQTDEVNLDKTVDETTHQDDDGEKPKTEIHIMTADTDTDNTDTDTDYTSDADEQARRQAKKEAAKGENPKKTNDNNHNENDGHGTASGNPDTRTLDVPDKPNTEINTHTQTEVDRGGRRKKKKKKNQTDSETDPPEAKAPRNSDHIDVSVGRYNRRVSLTHITEKIKGDRKLREDDVINTILVHGNISPIMDLEKIPGDIYQSTTKGIAALLHKYIGPWNEATKAHPKLRFTKKYPILPLWEGWCPNENENNYTFGLINNINKLSNRK